MCEKEAYKKILNCVQCSLGFSVHFTPIGSQFLEQNEDILFICFLSKYYKSFFHSTNMYWVSIIHKELL